jgi:hypothetical protein
MNGKKNQGFIFNPTIRWKIDVSTQDEDVKAEK